MYYFLLDVVDIQYFFHIQLLWTMEQIRNRAVMDEEVKKSIISSLLVSVHGLMCTGLRQLSYAKMVQHPVVPE